MRIVFMGTPDFAVPCLKRLLDDGNEVVGVFTQPDKPKGRGYTLTPPPVKVFAEENGIPVFQPKSDSVSPLYCLFESLLHLFPYHLMPFLCRFMKLQRA